jgi:hypothetical protein
LSPLALVLVMASALSATAAEPPDAGPVTDGGPPAGQFVEAEIVNERHCTYTVTVGTEQGVKAGSAATFLDAKGKKLAEGTVDYVFPNLSKVWVATSRCWSIIPGSFAGVKVRIQGQAAGGR